MQSRAPQRLLAQRRLAGGADHFSVDSSVIHATHAITHAIAPTAHAIIHSIYATHSIYAIYAIYAIHAIYAIT